MFWVIVMAAIVGMVGVACYQTGYHDGWTEAQKPASTPATEPVYFMPTKELTPQDQAIMDWRQRH